LIKNQALLNTIAASDEEKNKSIFSYAACLARALSLAQI
jgi:hypothetical protein